MLPREVRIKEGMTEASFPPHAMSMARHPKCGHGPIQKAGALTFGLRGMTRRLGLTRVLMACRKVRIMNNLRRETPFLDA